MTATEQEILQQPAAWRQVGADLDRQRSTVRTFLGPVYELPGLRIVLTGAGSSAFAGELLSPALTRRLHRRVDAVATTDLVSNPRDVFAEQVPTLLVSFARSGNSPESLAATRLADQLGSTVRHLILTCNADGELAREHDRKAESLVLLMPPITDDRGFAMTSSFTSMVLSAWCALTDAGVDHGMIEELAVAAEGMNARRDDLRALAGRCYRRVVYLGSGPLRAAARESALKLLELTAGEMISYHDSSLGFRHGPKSVLRGDTLVVVYVSNDPYTRCYDHDIAAEVRAAVGADNVLVISGDGTGDRGPMNWQLPGVAAVDDALLALPMLVAAQWLAYESSVTLGLTPDNPFPDGQVNRVVQGVTIHRLV
jgi:tagatose-6-phosphate ketose/aldose isomerase